MERTCADEVVYIFIEEDADGVWRTVYEVRLFAIGTATAVQRSEGDCTIGGIDGAWECVP
jgi:hypothetical protein